MNRHFSIIVKLYFNMSGCYMRGGFVMLTLLFIIFPIPTTKSKDHVCGKPIGSKFRLEEDRIVAGYDIGYYRYPWYAALIRYGKVVCGGALIGPRTVITAAHCYKEFLYLANKKYLRLEPIYTVKMGVYNICTTEDTQRNYKIEKVEIHEMYYGNNPYYDIALLTLTEDTSAYEPICLPKFELKEKPKDGTVPGLGTLKYQGAMPCTVHEARLLIYNDSDCHNMIKKTGNNDTLIKNAFCAGYLQGGIDTCQGDSGGPLQYMDDNGDFTLLGIVSFGFRCAVPGLLGMYTDVSEYLDWIQEKSGLDAGIVNTIYNKTSPTSKPNSVVNNQDSHKKRRHYGKPFRRPIKVILLKNGQFHPMIKTMLHHPIV